MFRNPSGGHSAEVLGPAALDLIAEGGTSPLLAGNLTFAMGPSTGQVR